MDATPAPQSRQGSPRDAGEESSPHRFAWRMAMEAVWALMARFDEDFRESVGIDVKTYDVLLHTHNAGEDGVRMTVLAREVVVTKADLTKMIDRLEHKGLVARTADPRDRRAIRVTLIGEGAHLPGRGHGAPGRDPWALRRPHVRIRGAHQCRGVQWRPAVQPVGHQRQLTPSRPSERKQAAR